MVSDARGLRTMGVVDGGDTGLEEWPWWQSMSAKSGGCSDAACDRAVSVVDGDEGLKRSRSLHSIIIFIRYRRGKKKDHV